MNPSVFVQPLPAHFELPSQSTDPQPILSCNRDGYCETDTGLFFKFNLVSSSAFHSQLIPTTAKSEEEKVFNDYSNLCTTLNGIIVEYNKSYQNFFSKEDAKKIIQDKMSEFITTNNYLVKKHYRPLHFLAHQCENGLNQQEIQVQDIDLPVIDCLKIETKGGYPTDSINLFLNSLSHPLATVTGLHPKVDESIRKDFLTLIQTLQELYKDLTTSQTSFDLAVIIEKLKEKIVKLENIIGITGNNRVTIESESWFEFVKYICTVFIEDLYSYRAKKEQNYPLQLVEIREIACNCAKVFYTFLKIKNCIKRPASNPHSANAFSKRLLDPSFIQDFQEKNRYRIDVKQRVDYLALVYLAKNLTDSQDLPDIVRKNLDYFSMPEQVKKIEDSFFGEGRLANTKYIDFEKCFTSLYYGNEVSFCNFKESLKRQILHPKKSVRRSTPSNRNKKKEEAKHFDFDTFASEAFPELYPMQPSIREKVVEKTVQEREDAFDLEGFAAQIESSISKEPDPVTDVDRLTYDAYAQLPEKVQIAICDYCQALTKVVRGVIRTASERGGFFYREGLCLTRLMNALVLPTGSQLSEKNQKACREYVLHLAGLLEEKECFARQGRFKEKLLDPIVALHAEELLWHLKCKEIKYKGEHIEESLQQKGFDAECSVPLFFIYECNGNVCLLPFAAFFLEGNLTGFVKENQGDAEQILSRLEIPFERLSVMGNQPGYQLSAEALSKLQEALLEASKEGKPPFLIFEHKRPPQKQKEKKVGQKRKRSSVRGTQQTHKRRRKEFDPVSRTAPLQEPTLTLTDATKRAPVLTTATLPSSSFPGITFWPRFSLQSAENVLRKASETQLASNEYKLLSWNKIMLERLQKENGNTSSLPPIWRLKRYQQAALDKMASLHSVGLFPLLCFDMGLGKTITYAAKIARFIAEGGKGDILVTVPPATLVQTHADLIDALTEAQYTAALSSLQHLEEFEENERRERIGEITNFVIRFTRSRAPSEDLMMIKRNERRKEMIQGLISLIPEDLKSPQLKKIETTFDFRLSEKKSPSFIPEIPFSYRSREQFQRIMQFRPDDCTEVLSTKKDDKNQKIILVTYPKLEAVDLNKYWGLVIFDEAQLIHTKKTARQQAAENLVRAAREINEDLQVLDSTGTPFENNLLEVLTLVNIANPGFIPKRLIKEFTILHKEAKKSIRFPDSKDCKKIICKAFIQFHILTSLLKKLFIYKSKTDRDVIADWEGAIPTKNLCPISIKFQDPIISKEAWEKLSQIRQDFKASPENLKSALRAENLILNHKDLTTVNIEDPTFGQLLERIRNNPKQELTHAPLISALFNSSPFNHALEAKENSLLFVHHKATANLLSTFLKEMYPGVAVEIFNGDTPPKERKAIIQRFQQQDNQGQILIISLKTGGVGLNFPQAKNAFFLTGSYNPAVQAQAEDRLIRGGSIGERSIYHIHLGTVGEKHLETIHRKKKRQYRFFFSKHLPEKEIDFNLTSLKKELRQFIKMLVCEKAHQKFKQDDFDAKGLIEKLSEVVCSYFEKKAVVFEERFRKVHPFTASPTTIDSEPMEVESTATTQEVGRGKRKREEEEPNGAACEKSQKIGSVSRPISDVMPLKDCFMIPWEKAELLSTLKLGWYFLKNKADPAIKAFLLAFDQAQQQNPSLRSNIRQGSYTDSPQEIREFYTNLKKLMARLPVPLSSKIYYKQNKEFYEPIEFVQGNGEESLRIRRWKREGGFNYDLLLPKSWFS